MKIDDKTLKADLYYMRIQDSCIFVSQCFHAQHDIDHLLILNLNISGLQQRKLTEKIY